MSSGKNAEYVRSLGADAVLDYTQPNFRLSAFCQEAKDKYDVVFDAVSNPHFSYEDEAKQCLKSPGGGGGEYVAINTRNFSDWPRAMVAQTTGLGFFQRKNFKLIMCKFDTNDIRQISDWFADGRLKVDVAKAVAFTEAGVREGFAQLKTERTVGKVVVQMF